LDIFLAIGFLAAGYFWYLLSGLFDIGRHYFLQLKINIGLECLKKM